MTPRRIESGRHAPESVCGRRLRRRFVRRHNPSWHVTPLRGRRPLPQKLSRAPPAKNRWLRRASAALICAHAAILRPVSRVRYSLRRLFDNSIGLIPAPAVVFDRRPRGHWECCDEPNSCEKHNIQFPPAGRNRQLARQTSSQTAAAFGARRSILLFLSVGPPGARAAQNSLVRGDGHHEGLDRRRG
jgi:hypothetical protein